jgi:multimeric flavodoxin WrbA
MCMMTERATDPRSFLFLLASGRDGGNTEALAREAAAHLPEHAHQRWLSLADHQLPVFADIRHADESPHQPSTDNERLLLDATLAATDIVIASPVYWYSVSSSAKLYLDHWSNWLRIPDLGFKARMGEKTFWSVSVLADEDPSMADPLLGTLRLSAGFFGARWGGGLLGNGSWPGDVRSDTTALDRARTFFAAEPAAHLLATAR